jgi:hypothetical protein
MIAQWSSMNSHHLSKFKASAVTKPTMVFHPPLPSACEPLQALFTRGEIPRSRIWSAG